MEGCVHHWLSSERSTSVAMKPSPEVEGRGASIDLRFKAREASIDCRPPSRATSGARGELSVGGGGTVRGASTDLREGLS